MAGDELHRLRGENQRREGLVRQLRKRAGDEAAVRSVLAVKHSV